MGRASGVQSALSRVRFESGAAAKFVFYDTPYLSRLEGPLAGSHWFESSRGLRRRRVSTFAACFHLR
jgi:hypothetical protein